MGGAAAGLVGAGDDGDERRAQQRLDQEQRLQLRVGARGREHHFGARDVQLPAQAFPRGFHAIVEGLGYAHQRRPQPQACLGFVRAAIGGLRNTAGGGRGKIQHAGTGKGRAAIDIAPIARIQGQAPVTAACQQIVQGLRQIDQLKAELARAERRRIGKFLRLHVLALAQP